MAPKGGIRQRMAAEAASSDAHLPTSAPSNTNDAPGRGVRQRIAAAEVTSTSKAASSSGQDIVTAPEHKRQGIKRGIKDAEAREQPRPCGVDLPFNRALKEQWAVGAISSALVQKNRS